VLTIPTKRPVRFFNTTGPCNPWDHYMLPPADRLVEAQLNRYIRDKLYWVLHAPRQTGKTTFIRDWAREINSGGDAIACYTSLEACQGISGRAEAMITMHKAICESARAWNVPIPGLPLNNPELLLYETMRRWAELTAPEPLVILFDEVDALEGDAMISFLRQLRSGFMDRGVGKFPVSIALVGMRDLKDYITAAKDGVLPSPLSPFNIKSDSILLGNFSQDDVHKLFSQRTGETGQQIADKALEYVWEQSQGQPWIINSLFERATMRILKQDDYSTITLEHVEKAREQMIQARETHLDSLGVRLRDPRIKHVIESILVGNNDPEMGRTSPDVELVMDLGLIKWNSGNGFTISNPIYEEILTRYLNSGYHDNLPPPSSWQWQKADGTLDMDSLLREFQRFWRRNSEIWEQKSDYTEAFPHLLLMAFLQRILNSGGRIEREAAAGRGRMDLFIEYQGDKYVIEIKLIHSWDSPEEIREEGLRQITMYRGKIDANAPSYLMIFDRRSEVKEKPWDERIYWQEETVSGGTVAVVGC
jgi:hypothetical protein